ncbi:MAG: thioester domain-containing protein [Bacilli bacterium]|nr:thioester domain-containing protein [Bacilli bacterium]
MKKRNVLFLALCAIVTIFCSLGVVSAATAPSSITVKRAEVLNDIITNHTHGFTIFTTSDGQYIYCMDVDKKALASGMTATASGNGDAGLLYILQNGYPYKTITGNDNIDKYVTQAAIWWYLDENKLSNEFKNATTTDIYQAIPKYIKPLVEGAKSAKDTQDTPSMTLTNNGTKMSLTSDSKYYESEYMVVTLTGAQSAEISLSGATKDTVIVDEGGNVGNTVSSGEKFKVRVPASEISSNANITVKASATGTIKRAKIFKPSDSTYQRVVGLYEENSNLNKEVTLSVASTKRVCEYTGGKYYGNDGTIVDKTTYEKQCKHVCEYTGGKYYGNDGTVVGKATYEKQCKHVCEYTGGKYYGKNGKEVSKDTYNSECSNICVYTNDKYYGKNGNVVDKTTYDQECGQEITVPNTSANIILWVVGLGVVAIASGIGFIIYHDRKNRHKNA